MTNSETTDNSCPVTLPERLDHAACAALAGDLAERRGQAIVLSGQNVRHLGGLAAEILLRARAEWRAADIAFTLQDPSPAFVQGIDLLGISRDALIDEVTE